MQQESVAFSKGFKSSLSGWRITATKTKNLKCRIKDKKYLTRMNKEAVLVDRILKRIKNYTVCQHHYLFNILPQYLPISSTANFST